MYKYIVLLTNLFKINVYHSICIGSGFDCVEASFVTRHRSTHEQTSIGKVEPGQNGGNVADEILWFVFLFKHD